MPKRVLIDASHREETRVVVLCNGRVEEFESETTNKKQVKGNIYLAKITRVEPSLQAAFVDYGGDKHGFLPFSEIHPDYYHLPLADKQELIDNIKKLNIEDEDQILEQINAFNTQEDSEKEPVSTEAGQDIISPAATEPSDINIETAEDQVANLDLDDEDIDSEYRKTVMNLYRKYKIQDVIKRGQIILVQVDKEERGNKGASLTTFISLAGKFCVLMPRSLRGGGISRRISTPEDRKRLKQIIKDLKIPDEIGLIVRTAGAQKNSAQIERDYDYLAGLWNNIREKTLESEAPAFIHAEGDIITRVLRDWYDDDVDELLIEGAEAYKSAASFTKRISPEATDRVKLYKNKVPIFGRFRAEEQISALFSPNVTLESGGSLVIEPTEALISIDVNSGKSTNTRNVEETATNTNIEAAREIARQLRLRNLSGLIVVDFIDMLDLKNKKTVERELKNAFALDRAKIQIGRISMFGLLEMSRQRLSPSFLEINTVNCSNCGGKGTLKSPGSTSVTILKSLEHEMNRNIADDVIKVRMPIEVANYILNYKRDKLSFLESNYKARIIIETDPNLIFDNFTIEHSGGKLIENNSFGSNNTSSNNNNTLASNNNLNIKDKDKEKEKDKDNIKKKNFEKNKPTDNNKITPPEKKSKKAPMFAGLWQKLID